MNKLLFEHQGKIHHWYNTKDKTHIVDIQTGEVVATTKNRVLYKRVISYGDDILYLGQDDVNTSIVKLKVN